MMGELFNKKVDNVTSLCECEDGGGTWLTGKGVFKKVILPSPIQHTLTSDFFFAF